MKVWVAVASAALASVLWTSGANAQQQDNPLQTIPMRIFQACMFETGGALGSDRFRECVLDKTRDEIIGTPAPQPPTPDNGTQVPAGDIVICSSVNNKRSICELSPVRRGNVALISQQSKKPCTVGETWGVNNRGVWVKKGCRGVFYIGTRPSNNPSYQTWANYVRENGQTEDLPKLPKKTKDGWLRCALENQFCSVPYQTRVRFGVPGQFTERTVKNKIACNRASFGEPAPMQRKACYYLPKKEEPPVIVPPVDPVEQAKAGPLRTARLSCQAQARKVLAAKGMGVKNTAVVLGLGHVGGNKANASPVLKLKGKELKGRGLFQSGKDTWSPFTFSCLLENKQTTAFNIEVKETGTAKTLSNLIPMRDKFTDNPAPTKGYDGTLRWQATGGDRPTLIHGVPETDDRDFLAVCNKRTGKIKVHMIAPPPDYKTGESTLVSIGSKSYVEDYAAKGGTSDNEAGVALPAIELSRSSPLWSQMIKDNDLAITIGGYLSHRVSLKGSAKPVRSFLASCR
ncbi:DUF3011 domain-containing protein [Rhodobacteraceae bacterium RKSG542]|uniref:DUF3011 domain-containing protein n=1 Tax=Pseudovibrio flavus TaxID=2529854 RepID=UPI0012BC7A98|nr:DUF3011 domain-containing protein [Pseudovibrio flavus]MTI19249.1 DUF3011 domain-containing protein [Pseudovibrio flavus]